MRGFLQKGFMYALIDEMCFYWGTCGTPSTRASSISLRLEVSNQPLHFEALRSACGELFKFLAADAFSMPSPAVSYSESHKQWLICTCYND